MPKTFTTIGDKEQYATYMWRNIICQWDDDDIALPNHLSNVNKYFTNETNILHWKMVYFIMNLILLLYFLLILALFSENQHGSYRRTSS
jgi:hypothetical protein